MIKSQFIRQINFETQKLLKRIHRQSSHHQVRQRSHCLLLKNQGVKIKQLKTIKNWQSLVDSVETMLREFGKQYVINFV